MIEPTIIKPITQHIVATKFNLNDKPACCLALITSPSTMLSFALTEKNNAGTLHKRLEKFIQTKKIKKFSPFFLFEILKLF